ncbi:hypothetical protein NLM33_25060 [Bradyrhizobium sp. CCGUVB1N3]|uniref:hypothetical protein n=1 Tax=Bradyrhizobium sp. CCGUVB1N3 TaxID=2949629 RepID=UPI0020B3772C|nr:hypothetical protein [Bradyrhizobium sp. CCGUVB1N3]MCP3471806.1 hypothetical protein [Bradyrhizobium sp. CCGUVB1N3]MCP3473588.1 hypothetical protein [Bradyrhizobium sp. CCGUVB1N3]
MTDRPASWRLPTPKQMEKMAAEVAVGRRVPTVPPVGPADPMPAEYWDALLRDAGADARQADPGIRTRRLADVPQHLLRVGCRRCGRTVEIQKADAVRLYGAAALWRDVGQRLLDNTCGQRTGRHEEDGCWPDFGGM